MTQTLQLYEHGPRHGPGRGVPPEEAQAVLTALTQLREVCRALEEELLRLMGATEPIPESLDDVD